MVADGEAVSSVKVDKRTAAFTVDGEELVITPHKPLRDHERFSVTVLYTSGPYLYTPDFNNFPIGILPFGWFSTQDGSVTAGQPDRAHEIYPVNDHTADKAGNQNRADFGPVARPSSSDFLELFSPNVYDGGALVLYALQQRIGERDFAELQRRWAKRYSGESASTFDFIRLAAKVSRDLGVVPFLARWPYGETIPPMPGHPDWVPPPATEAAAAATARLSARGLEVARLLKR